jgi:hypothetical protein
MRNMTAHSLGLSMFALLAACSVASPPNAVAGGAKVPPPPSAKPSEKPSEKPSGKPSAKISPEMVGKLSPIPAFIGQGEGWRVEIQALDATQHHIALEWTKTKIAESGTARYRGALDIARGSSLAIDGMLQTSGGAKTLRVEIRTEACTDTAGVVRPQRIAIAIEGRAPLNGCGDLAMY